MKVIKIKEDTMLVSLSADEALYRFGGAVPEICDRESRMRLRGLLCESCEQAGVGLSESVVVEMLGTIKIGFDIFVSPAHKADT